MDQVIAATGMSASAVYRYFRSKDELIDATVDEAFAETETLFDRLLDREPTPSPAEALGLMVDTVRARAGRTDYDLSRLAMQAWTEALRRPHLADRTRAFYTAAHRHFTELARRWRAAGHVPPGTDPQAVASLLVTLMPGILVADNLVGPVDAAALHAALAALGAATR